MQTRERQERVIEAVRLGLEGDAAVEFLCRSGYPATSPAIARQLRLFGGRKAIEDCIKAGKSNVGILEEICPGEGPIELPHQPPKQRELFDASAHTPAPSVDMDMPLYETTKLTLRLPRDVYEAVRVAAKAENKPQNQVIVDILTAALSRMP